MCPDKAKVPNYFYLIILMVFSNLDFGFIHTTHYSDKARDKYHTGTWRFNKFY